jgi:predicted ATPase
VKAPRPAESVAKIASGLRFVSELLGKTEIPVIVVATFEQAVTLLTAASFEDVEPEVFQTLGRAARHAEAALVEEIAKLQAALAAERERLADSVLLGDDADAQVLDRHRSRLSRELGAHLGNLKLLRDLAVPAKEGEAQQPIPVELRVVGRGTP